MSNDDARFVSACAPAPVAAEWMPLDGLIGQWAAFASEPQAVSALALQLIGDAFLACSCEMSAHKEYILEQDGDYRDRPRFLTRGLDECITQLSEACSRWSSVLYWLARLDDEPDDVLEVVRHMTEATRTQRRRVERLLLRVQEEQVQALRRREGVRP
jgi:hypothetical protein